MVKSKVDSKFQPIKFEIHLYIKGKNLLVTFNYIHSRSQIRISPFYPQLAS
eukprot:c23950_g2_i1 orf=32-184(+)